MSREYRIRVSENGRPTIILNKQCETHIPYNVWRDLGRLAVMSRVTEEGGVVFEFLLKHDLLLAEEVLKGGMWEKKE